MSKIIIIIIFAVFSHQIAYALESVSELVWNSRIIIVRTTNEFEEILNSLKKQEHELQDRDIYWFVFLDEKTVTNYQGELQPEFYANTLNKYFMDANTNVVFIGKDGGIKQKERY